MFAFQRNVLRLLALTTWVSAVAPMYSQEFLDEKVFFTCDDCTPSEALQQLSRQTGANIVFSEKLFQDCKSKSYDLQNISLLSAVKTVISCAPVEYRVLGATIALTRHNTRIAVSGFVRDQETGEKLIGAALLFSGKSTSGAVTNEFGFYSVMLEEGSYHCKVAYTGYQSKIQPVQVNEGARISFSLAPSTTLPEVLVTALPGGEIEEGISPQIADPKTLPLDRLRTLAMPGGESDLLRLVAFEPGVQTGVDGLGGLHVRGGNADQNLFLLDDVPVYNPGHSLGLFSIFNPSTVSQARLWKGDAPARFGGRTSAVLDVRTRDGNQRDYHAEASAALFASTLTLEGPVVRDRSALLVSGRTTYFKPWLDFLGDEENLLTFSGDQVAYRFFDLNLKWNYRISNNDHLYFSIYKGGDAYSDILKQQSTSPEGLENELYGLSSNWGNTIAALRWNHLLGKRIFSNTVLRYSTFEFQSKQDFRSVFLSAAGKESVLYDFGEFYRTDINDWSVKSDFTWYAANHLVMRWGGAFTHHEFRPGALSINYLQPGQSETNFDSIANAVLNNERLVAYDFEGYVDAEWQIARLFRLEAGIRGTAFKQENAFYTTLQPGLRFVVGANEGLRGWSGYHRNAQNLHQIGSYNISLPFELWVPSTEKVAPELTGQFSAGLGWQKDAWSVSLEGYDKHFDRVLTFLSSGGALFNGGSEDASGWEDRVTAGTGRSVGLEAAMSYNRPSTELHFSYTLSKTDRQFEKINSGEPFPFRYDRRHSLSVGMRKRILPWLSADVSWVFATGYPITLTGVKYVHETPTATSPYRSVLVYSEVNGYRLPAYHRLDAALLFSFDRKKIDHFIQLGVYNAYNRANPFYLYVNAGATAEGNAVQYTLLPVLPVLQYRVKI